MATIFDTFPYAQNFEVNAQMLAENEYPGRVIVMGLDQLGTHALQTYALMGRSPDSRDRIFSEEQDGFRTTSPTKTEAEMAAAPNSKLIYYKAIRNGDGLHVVSNGAQTDPIFDALTDLQVDLEQASIAAPEVDGIKLSRYEPDDPNFTPRITGVVDLRASAPTSFGMTEVRKDIDSSVPVYNSYKHGTVQDVTPGVGYVIQTYNGNGNPLPSFDRKPYAIELGKGVEDTAKTIWGLLNKDNRVALVTQAIDLASGEAVDHYMIDIHS